MVKLVIGLVVGLAIGSVLQATSVVDVNPLVAQGKALVGQVAAKG